MQLRRQRTYKRREGQMEVVLLEGEGVYTDVDRVVRDGRRGDVEPGVCDV